jgi:hypothetical protein
MLELEPPPHRSRTREPEPPPQRRRRTTPSPPLEPCHHNRSVRALLPLPTPLSPCPLPCAPPQSAVLPTPQSDLLPSCNNWSNALARTISKILNAFVLLFFSISYFQFANLFGKPILLRAGGSFYKSCVLSSIPVHTLLKCSYTDVLIPISKETIWLLSEFIQCWLEYLHWKYFPTVQLHAKLNHLNSNLINQQKDVSAQSTSCTSLRMFRLLKKELQPKN